MGAGSPLFPQYPTIVSSTGPKGAKWGQVAPFCPPISTTWSKRGLTGQNVGRCPPLPFSIPMVSPRGPPGARWGLDGARWGPTQNARFPCGPWGHVIWYVCKCICKPFSANQYDLQQIIFRCL